MRDCREPFGLLFGSVRMIFGYMDLSLHLPVSDGRSSSRLARGALGVPDHLGSSSTSGCIDTLLRGRSGRSNAASVARSTGPCCTGRRRRTRSTHGSAGDWHPIRTQPHCPIGCPLVIQPPWPDGAFRSNHTQGPTQRRTQSAPSETIHCATARVAFPDASTDTIEVVGVVGVEQGGRRGRTAQVIEQGRAWASQEHRRWQSRTC